MTVEVTPLAVVRSIGQHDVLNVWIACAALYRTKAALQAKKAAGALLGNRANLRSAGSAGRVAQAQAADDFAASVVPILDAVRKSGATTLADIADALNARGIRSATGGVWHRSSVRNLLTRAKFCEA